MTRLAVRVSGNAKAAKAQNVVCISFSKLGMSLIHDGAFVYDISNDSIAQRSGLPGLAYLRTEFKMSRDMAVTRIVLAVLNCFPGIPAPNFIKQAACAIFNLMPLEDGFP